MGPFLHNVFIINKTTQFLYSILHGSQKAGREEIEIIPSKMVIWFSTNKNITIYNLSTCSFILYIHIYIHNF